MELNVSNSAFWNKRYNEQKTGWDIGYPSPALINYVENNVDKTAHILIPGAGKAYELEYLWTKGYKNTFALDFAPKAKKEFLFRCPNIPEKQYLVGNFFDFNTSIDLLLEQTFFCAIDPSWRKKYVAHAAQILKPTGKIAGLLFDKKFEGGPPFGGSKSEYINLFSSHFRIKKMEAAHNSIDSRANNELFIEFLTRKENT